MPKTKYRIRYKMEVEIIQEGEDSEEGLHASEFNARERLSGDFEVLDFNTISVEKVEEVGS